MLQQMFEPLVAARLTAAAQEEQIDGAVLLSMEASICGDTVDGAALHHFCCPTRRFPQ